VNLYDQAPVGNSIPFSAALLSSGTIGATIVEGKANTTLPVILAGVVEGAEAGNAGTLTSGGAAGASSFVIEVTDADANVILTSSGAQTRTGGAVSLTLTVPSGIAGVTVLDVTQNPNGTGASSISGVNPGDTIQVSSSASTPAVIGIPVVVALGTTPIGLARVPSNGGGTPSAVPTSYPGTVNEIAAIPPWTSLDTFTYGAGFIMLSNTGSQVVTGFVVAPSTHTPTLSFQCTVGGGETLDHIAKGVYPSLVFAQHTATDVTLNTSSESGGTCATGTQAFSALSQYGAGPSVASWNDAADDGAGNLGGALVLSGSGGNGQNAIVTGPENGSVSGGGNAIGNAGNQANIDSLQMWYDKASVVTKGIDEVAYRNAQNGLAISGLAASSPVASAADDAGNVYILFQDGAGTVEKCALGSTTTTCTYAGALAAYNPSYDHRSMALGADGILYVATASGFVHFNPANNTSYSNGSTAYKQVVASGDGHIYLLHADGSGVDAYP
jgi:hypothetical protein